jgi:hypothetical protein
MIIVLNTMTAVEYLARWMDGVNIYYQIDLMTVCLFIWQLIALILQWMWHDLASPILLLEQGSFIIFMGFQAFMFHNIIFRYLPTQITLGLLWLLSAIDM